MPESASHLEPVVKHDLLTVIAISIVVYTIANLLHEGLGHGGACLAVGCKPLLLTSVNFQGNEDGLAKWAIRLISAGGTIVNLIAGLIALALLRKTFNVHWRFFVWLFATVNLMQATGYWLFSGVANIGDWSSVIDGWSPWWLWRMALALIGGASYWYCTRLAMIRLGPFIGGDQMRGRRALSLTLVPYFTGALLYTISGIFNPMGLILVALSAMPASLGGTSGLAWGPNLLRGNNLPPAGEGPIFIPRNRAWIIVGAIAMLLLIFVLGPGIRLG